VVDPCAINLKDSAVQLSIHTYYPLSWSALAVAMPLLMSSSSNK
jgi:hypothetical protein